MPTRSPELIEQLGRAYALGTPLRPLATLFGVTKDEVIALARSHGWGARADKTPAERAAAARAAEAARALELYGDAGTIDAVKVLRSRGFVVYRAGPRVWVGNSLRSLPDLRSLAAREMRLLTTARVD